MKRDLVSIIIPTFNRATLIGETLDSIINQSYTNWECLVVDDGSTDQTETVVLKYIELDTRISYHKRPPTKPKGANACRNYGLELSQGEYINWFDSDDMMYQDKLTLQVKGIQKSKLSFSLSQTLVFENTVENIVGLNSQEISSNSIIEDFLTKKIVWLTQAPLLKKEFLIENNLYFDEQLQAGQDWEFFMRLLFVEKEYHVIKEPLVYLRRHQNNISNSNNLNKEWYYFLARYKIYKAYKKEMTPKMKTYLRFFFLKYFKAFLRKANYRKAHYIWKKCILGDDITTFKEHTLLVLSFISFLMFKKGDMFLTKVT